MGQPLFIAIDGVDGSGKTTQCRLLAQWLTQHQVPVVVCRDPGCTPLGDQLRHLLLERAELAIETHAEALLFMAARAQMVTEVIRPALQRGSCVLCDRFLLANVVYQGHAGGLDPEQLWQIGRWATQGLEPDLTVVLDLDDLSLTARRKQVQPDRVEQRDAEFHRRVRDGYRYECHRQPERIFLIPADGDIEVVFGHLRGHLLPHFRAHGWHLEE
ncbi:MAG: dTMP kinase [Gemmataceae bacterium]|nr:dTMP kinase [Gemmataceae bacterium]MCS7269664.1 dTMP kinase [Gemmataceae bacterium]MDW8244029.1 dTMP kinase [Thermogemmata sp.]